MTRTQATADLMRRYGRVLGHAWRDRRQFDAPRRLSHEAEFLPAALALQDAPVSPAPRVAMWLLMAFAVIAVSWAVFGRIDIVATAGGKIIPNDRTKTIQPMETARVTAIHVRDGQHVQAGQLLVELDATLTEADAAHVGDELVIARLDGARARAMLAALDGGRPVLPAVGEVDPARFAQEQRLLNGQYGEYQAKLRQLSAEIDRREAELRTTAAMIRKLELTVPIARGRAEDYKGLLAQNFVSRHGYLEREQEAIERERDLAAQQGRAEEIRAALVEATRQREALTAEVRHAMLDRLHEAEQKVAALTQEMTKAQSRNSTMRLVAPVDGTVQHLAIHTVGGVVTPAQPLMAVVPGNDTLEIEAFVENKDIGFVRPGQDAVVKVETFPFTRYGTLSGKVIQVSNDAVQDEKRGLVYAARVRLERASITVDGKTLNLTPGMAVTSEIKTGRRRVIEYFLSPLLQYGDESLRER